MTSSPTMKLPTGAWQRDWIQRRGGAREHGVTVRYVQTPSVFADLRIAADRPALPGAASLADLSDGELAALAAQNGFAGVTTIDGASATWHHEIDYQPAGGGVDRGRIEPAGPGKMLEHGLDDSYVESWSLVEPDTGPYLAVRIARGGGADEQGAATRDGDPAGTGGGAGDEAGRGVDQLLAVAGGRFLYARARSRRGPQPVGDSLRDAIARSHATRETILAYLDCEISYGTVRGWQIERSTLPWREGKRLGLIDQIRIDAGGALGPRAAADREIWSFPVNTFPVAELRALFATR